MNDLKEGLSELGLKAFVQNLDAVLEKQPESREAILQAMTELAQAEMASQKERSVAYRIEQARFEQIQTVETFDFNDSPAVKAMRKRYLQLLEVDFIAQSLCVLFVGDTGMGKTHLARALGYRSCQQGVRVLFTTLSRMTLDLVAAEASGNLKKTLDRYVQPALLIVDEMGYVGLREVESNLVFQILSARYDKRKSTVVTTNRIFGEWNQIFHSDPIAHAILDRLTERSEVFHLKGKGYRERHRQSLKT